MGVVSPARRAVGASQLSVPQRVQTGLYFRGDLLHGNHRDAVNPSPQFCHIDLLGQREIDRVGMRTDIGILPVGCKPTDVDWGFAGIESYKRLHLISNPAGYEQASVTTSELFDRWPYGATLGLAAQSPVMRERRDHIADTS